ncbi:MAG: RNA-binding transcriptional accessory protein, partial [Eubacterium sp.]|nr:RNA-binding transcriptional accessory protein [Eubacterium sp.]
MDMISQLAGELGVKKSQVQAAVELIDAGNTIPFIARYRKEATGGLNDEVLRNLSERLVYLRNLEEKKEQVISVIAQQEKLTPELEKKILAAETMVAVEDLYRPYRPKKRTRATMAKEKGLEPLASLLFLQKTRRSMEEEADAFISEENNVADTGEALDGARDIIAEMIADQADYRESIRKCTMKEGYLTVKAKDEKASSVYEMYYDFREPLSKITGYRILAINRGEKEKFLTVKIEAPEEQIIRALDKTLVRDNPQTKIFMEEAVEDAYKRLIAPSIERDIRAELTRNAQEGAISVFGKNLKQLLMQPPMEGRTVLGWDPAFRTGCKLAVVDPTGKVLDTVVIYPTEPQNKVKEAKKTLHQLIKKYGISVISLGNGTASRESEQIIAEFLKEIPEEVSYVIVNEAGASVYSASKLATEEFPDFDVGQRSAASIARRRQDPLAELVKIEPKA